MTSNQDYLSGGEGTFNFVLDNGKCEFFPYPVAVFEAKKAGNIGTFHLGKGPQVSEALLKLGLGTPVPPVQGRDHKGPTDSISSVSFRPTLGCCPDQGCLQPSSLTL